MSVTSSRRRRLLLAAGVTALALVAVPSVIAGTGIGGVFNLGKTNKVNAPTTLTGTSSSPMFKVTNKGNGTALQLTTKTTVPPLKVNSSVKVTNLNADKVDGLSSSAFMPAGAKPDAATLDGLDSSAFMPAGANPDAATLDGIDSTGFTRSSGQILIQAGASSWKPFNTTDPLAATYFSSETQWTRSAAGSSFLSTSPDLPSVMYGKALQLNAVELCFNPFAGTTLTYVEINTQQSSTGPGGRNLRLSDPTTRTTAACNLYQLSTPVVLTAEMNANLFLQANWGSAGATFSISRATFVLEPTTTNAVAPSSVVVKGDRITADTKSKVPTAPSK